MNRMLFRINISDGYFSCRKPGRSRLKYVKLRRAPLVNGIRTAYHMIMQEALALIVPFININNQQRRIFNTNFTCIIRRLIKIEVQVLIILGES